MAKKCCQVESQAGYLPPSPWTANFHISVVTMKITLQSRCLHKRGDLSTRWDSMFAALEKQ